MRILCPSQNHLQLRLQLSDALAMQKFLFQAVCLEAAKLLFQGFDLDLRGGQFFRSGWKRVENKRGSLDNETQSHKHKHLLATARTSNLQRSLATWQRRG